MNDFRTDWIILIIAVFVGFSTAKRQKFAYLKTIPAFLIVSLAVELVGRYYRLQSINNVWLFNLFTTFELAYFTYILYLILKRKFIVRLTVFVIVICLLNILCIQGIRTFHTYSYAISVLVIVFLCVYYYYITFKEVLVENLLVEPSFWIVTGLLVFFAASLSVLGVVNFIAVLPKEMIRLTRNILLTVNGIFYFILIIAFTCQINSRKSIPNS